jgi:adenylylsulfate kinase-like enzyme
LALGIDLDQLGAGAGNACGALGDGLGLLAGVAVTTVIDDDGVRHGIASNLNFDNADDEFANIPQHSAFES